MNGTSTLFPQAVRSKALMCILIAVTVLAGASTASSMTDIYQLSQQSSAQPTNMSGSTTIWGPYSSYANSGSSLTNIGFTFMFDKQPYTTFSVSTGGMMTLGAQVPITYIPYVWPNYPSTSYMQYPMIAPYWSMYSAPNSVGKVHYKVSGVAPNRFLTVEWNNCYVFNQEATNGFYYGGTWQARLYEGSGRIEFWYGQMNYESSGGCSYPATIGIARSGTRYLTVYGNNVSQNYLYPNGQYFFYRYPCNYPMTANTQFNFSPCDAKLDTILGNVAQGGSARMQSGDVLLNGKQVMRGNVQGYQPFSFDMPGNPCSAFTYSISFSGAAAADYTAVPSSGVITDGLKPTIDFTPRAVGARPATMTLSLSTGHTYTYNLNAEGVTRILYTGNIPQGGTATMTSGNTLLTNIQFPRFSSTDLQPFTITNINATPSAPSLANAALSMTLLDTFDQYQLGLQKGSTTVWSTDGTTESIVNALAPGEVGTVVIRMRPNASGRGRGTGYQGAYLIVTADQEVRNFHIQGYSVAPAMEFTYEGENLAFTDRRLFRGDYGCVGNEAIGGAMVVTNTNRVPVTFTGMEVLENDPTVGPTTPPYRLQTDLFGNPIPMVDYFLSASPLTTPVPANDLVEFPLTLQPGESRTLYLGFIAQRPGQRYGRVFLHSDAVNFVGKESDAYLPTSDLPNAPELEGIFVLDMNARGIGGTLAKDVDGSLNGLSMTFPAAKVSESSTSEVMIYNTGECDLLIRKSDVTLMAGDVEDFEILEVLPNTPVNAQGDFVIAPGGSDKITARFTPIRSGSRRATAMLRTNDSTVILEGITDRGIYNLDFYGFGAASLEARVSRLAPAVLGLQGSPGNVRASNESTENVTITSVTIVGPDAADFVADPSRPWPSMPRSVTPTAWADFGFIFAPAAGSTPGPRSAMMQFTISNGETVSVPLNAVAGTRELAATPAVLFQNGAVAVGSLARQNAVITNVGTFPVRVSGMTITGPAAADYKLGGPTAMVLSPGESRFIEVTYMPSLIGASDALLSIMSDATNGTQTVTLSGAGATTEFTGDPNGSSTMSPQGGQGAGRTVGGTAFDLSAALPNPARESAEISYSLAAEGEIVLALYDGFGRRVATVEEGWRDAGAHTVRVSVKDLASGVYYYRLNQGGKELMGRLQVVR